MHESVPLTDRHSLSGFDSGKPDLDEWLKKQALHAAAMRTARTFVWTDDAKVVAYYALSGHQVNRDAVAPRVARGSPTHIPAVLLAKLVLDRSLHGQRHGAALLVDAMERIVAATEIVAARLVVVDAVDEDAVSFYEHFGFVRTAPDSLRLVQKVSDIAKALER